MTRNWLPRIARAATNVAALVLLTALPAAAQSEIVLHTKNASAVMGDWQLVADSSAASGARMWNPDRGGTKLSSALASPYDYFELTFNAEAGRAYRLWLRATADYDSYTNDSAFVQFSGAVSSSGAAVYRIGTSNAAVYSLEECSSCGSYRWGWNDNGWEGLGPVVYFATTGQQKIRIQKREDGLSIDQVVLSASSYAYGPPGAYKNDSTLLSLTTTSTTTTQVTSPTTSTTTSTSGGTEIIVPVASYASLYGDWQVVSDSTAAGGARAWSPDRGAAKLSYPYASPSDYFEVTFNVEAGKPYRLWLRGKAQNDSYTNDSVFVQFSGSLNSSGQAAFRIGTTSATIVSIERGSNQGLGGWGWSDNGWDSVGELIYFAATGPQKLRVQRREDGISIDQVVLSPSKYLSSAPGAAKYDTTILAGGTSTTTTDSTTTSPEPAPTTTAPSTSTSSGSGVKLKVLEWNLHHGVGSDGAYNLDRIASWMAKLNPDVIMLNEVEKYTSWGNEDQPERYRQMLVQKTGRTWYMHFTQEFGQWYSNGKGHVILSVYPFDSKGYTTTTQSSGLNGAGAVGQATITVNGRTINLVLGHLDPYDQTMRLTQAQEVLRYASGFAENRIIAGDMNAWPDQSSILEINKTYYDSWTVAANQGTATGIADITPFGATKKGRIDYIFYSKNAPNLVVLSSWTPDTRDSYGYMPSDHRPVLTTFEVR